MSPRVTQSSGKVYVHNIDLSQPTFSTTVGTIAIDASNLQRAIKRTTRAAYKVTGQFRRVTGQRGDGMPPPVKVYAALHKDLYVIAMGWPRWGPAARLRWLRRLRRHGIEMVAMIDELLGEPSTIDVAGEVKHDGHGQGTRRHPGADGG